MRIGLTGDIQTEGSKGLKKWDLYEEQWPFCISLGTSCRHASECKIVLAQTSEVDPVAAHLCPCRISSMGDQEGS